jgi:hypothetical protein
MLRSIPHQAQPGKARNALSRRISHLRRKYLKRARIRSLNGPCNTTPSGSDPTDAFDTLEVSA